MTTWFWSKEQKIVGATLEALRHLFPGSLEAYVRRPPVHEGIKVVDVGNGSPEGKAAQLLDGTVINHNIIRVPWTGWTVFKCDVTWYPVFCPPGQLNLVPYQDATATETDIAGSTVTPVPEIGADDYLELYVTNDTAEIRAEFPERGLLRMWRAQK